MKNSTERDAAWARLNAVLDANGGQDTAEYRAAWAEWERLVDVEGSPS